jgi:hypothetical protein
MSFKNWARDVLHLLSRFKKRELIATVDGETKNEANRLAQVASSIFNRRTARTNASEQVNISASTATTTSQQVPTSEIDETPVAEVVLSNTEVKPVPQSTTRRCLLCTEEYEGEELLKTQFPFTCGTCEASSYCVTCIKDWFIDACRNESKMPPKCCYAIPITTVSSLLDDNQVSISCTLTCT